MGEMLQPSSPFRHAVLNAEPFPSGVPAEIRHSERMMEVLRHWESLGSGFSGHGLASGSVLDDTTTTTSSSREQTRPEGMNGPRLGWTGKMAQRYRAWRDWF